MIEFKLFSELILLFIFISDNLYCLNCSFILEEVSLSFNSNKSLACWFKYCNFISVSCSSSNFLSNKLSGSILHEIGSILDIIINAMGKLLYKEIFWKTLSFPVKERHKFFDKGFFLKDDIMYILFI